jgi:N6-L-threonylcarbamoyladenine synthase
VLRTVQQLQGKSSILPVEDLAASFQAAVVDVLITKTLQVARVFKPKEILVAGGVSANQALRDAFQAQNEFPVHIPPLAFCTDNAAMIAAAGTYRFLSDRVDNLGVDVMPVWPLS